MYTQIYTRSLPCSSSCMFVCVFICVHVCVYTHTRTHTHAHASVTNNSVGVLESVAVFCSVLQCVVVSSPSVTNRSVCVAVCWGVLQRVAVCYRVLSFFHEPVVERSVVFKFWTCVYESTHARCVCVWMCVCVCVGVCVCVCACLCACVCVCDTGRKKVNFWLHSVAPRMSQWPTDRPTDRQIGTRAATHTQGHT